MTARSLNIGFQLSSTTTITVTLPSADSAATGCLYRGDDSTCHALSLINGNTQLQITAGAGDHVITVDTTNRPSISTPCTVSFGGSVPLWSAQHPDPGGTRPLANGNGATVSVKDTKDPWPELTGGNSTSATFASSSSTIYAKMNNLISTNNGRSGVEEADDDTTAAAS